MDEGLSRAVLKVFVALHKQGLIYKDKRLVNWDPRLQTAVSDLEVESIEIKGKLWHIKYPIEGEAGRFITVATTRPETMLGDIAVAVHPDDERYKELVGKKARLPLAGRLIPIIADEYSDPEKGTGAVKITPGHDFNDFEVGKRHKLPLINILTREAQLNDEVPPAYRGLDRFEARKRVVADLEAAGPAREDRGHRPRRPARREDQDRRARALSHRAMVHERHAARREGDRGGGKRTYTDRPEQWENVYFNWMRNIQPWCISRQLWWGHQIPAWYGPDGKIFVEETESRSRAPRPRSITARRRSSRATKTCSTPGSHPRCGRSRRWAGRTRRPSLRATIRRPSSSPRSTSSSSGSRG